MASRSRSSRSSRQSSSGSAGSARVSEDQLVDLLSKLQHLIDPEARSRRAGNRVSASKVLQETCNYIKTLHQDVDDLSERLAELLASMDVDNAQAAMIRSLLLM